MRNEQNIPQVTITKITFLGFYSKEYQFSHKRAPISSLHTLDNANLLFFFSLVICLLQLYNKSILSFIIFLVIY